MIILTTEQATKVRGRSPRDNGHALNPVPLKDGRFMLGEQVLNDPAHDDVQEFLVLLPREPLEGLPVYTEADASDFDRANDGAVGIAQLEPRKRLAVDRDDLALSEERTPGGK
ncbi:MAG: hypothetical protein KIS68_16030 [Bauldia sp.]|nr:hypothetical protein [Bauldia sp.]